MLNEPAARIIVDQVEFDGPTNLPAAARQTAVSALTHRDFPHDSNFESSWLQEFLGPWQDRGYFKAEASAKQVFVREEGYTTHVRMIVHINEGKQFRLGDIQFLTGDSDEPLVFPAEKLRKEIPLKEGDLLDAGKIREGLDALKRLYAVHGYIDMVATPLTDVDAARQRVSLVMEMDQQKQFRVASTETLGLAPEMEAQLKSKLKPGSIFNPQTIQDFLTQNARSLPPYLSPSSFEIRRDVTAATVDVRLSITQTCQRDD